MRNKRILALLCALCLCMMDAASVLPATAEADAGEATVVANETANKKKKKKKTEAEPEKTAAPTPAPVAETVPEPVVELTETPAEEIVETPAAEPTEAPAEATETPAEATETPTTEAPTETPTEAPTTEAPTETPTEATTEAPTETPTEAPTDAPTEAPTEEPTDAPTEEPTAEPTEEPTEEPTAEPTPRPQVSLKRLKASRDVVKPGRKVKFTFEAENADKIVWSALRSDGLNGGSGVVKKGDSFTWKPAETGIYTVTVNATADGVTVSDRCVVTVRKSALKVSVSNPYKYAQVGGLDLRYDLEIRGGCEPYNVEIVIDYKDKAIFKLHEFVSPVICQAAGYGDHRLTVTVKDAAGDTVEGEATILAATDATNDAPPLPALTADMTFAERLVAVAESQLGYHESEENFIFRDDGARQGWSFYGGWAGMPYEEWCAMFVSYCLTKAGIDQGVMPQCANCNRWKNMLGKRYIDEEDEYIPAAGDLIFYHHDRVSKDPNFPNHVGIVTDYDPEKDIVYTVEGNSGQAVSARQYDRENTVIVGYVSMRQCMLRWDKAYMKRLEDNLAADLARIKSESARAAACAKR